MKKVDMMGKRIGYLTVIKEAESQNGLARWLCKCDCGNEKIIAGAHLREGRISSCGCMHYKYGHGKTNTKLYNVWRTMKTRCGLKTSEKYERYGGRGIKVCDEWKKDFSSFYKWAINNGYRDGLTIDRIDNNKGYSPKNCRWVTALEQANNTSKNKIIEYKGEKTTVAQMARKYGLNPIMFRKRLKRGWSAEQAIETPKLDAGVTLCAYNNMAVLGGRNGSV